MIQKYLELKLEAYRVMICSQCKCTGVLKINTKKIKEFAAIILLEQLPNSLMPTVAPIPELLKKLKCRSSF